MYNAQYNLLSGDTSPGAARTWGLPRGRYWEWRFPVKASAPVSGGQLQGRIKVFDGNFSPILPPTALLYAFGATPQPAVLYDTPSTQASPTMPGAGGVGTAPTKYGVWSKANVFTNGAPGTVRLMFGTTQNDLVQRGAVPVDASGASWNIWTDWDEGVAFPDLVPGATYRWRAVFDPTAAGANTTGALQSFTVPQLCRGLPVTVSIGLGQQPTEGNDVILGTAGVDPINGGGGNDTICAGGGNDSIDGGAGTDAIDGGAGRDNIVGGPDNDTIIGGAGVDTASYAGATAVVTVSLTAAGAQNTGGGGTDTISTVENLTGGTKGDRLTGNASANAFDGGAGSDRCDGKAGRDTQTRCETRVSIP
jgi:Ca2+-binding RTX toxin-like protein